VKRRWMPTGSAADIRKKTATPILLLGNIALGERDSQEPLDRFVKPVYLMSAPERQSKGYGQERGIGAQELEHHPG
jgi:hypothetical protein